MRLGVSLSTFAAAAETTNVVDRAVELGSQAERLGLDSVWFAQMASYDAIAVASAVGRAVPRISVGTAVVPIYPRHPQILASAAKTAQAATGGRCQLKSRTLGDTDAAVTVTQSRVHGHGTIFPVSSLCVSQPHDRHHSQRPATTAPQLKTRAYRLILCDPIARGR